MARVIFRFAKRKTRNMELNGILIDQAIMKLTRVLYTRGGKSYVYPFFYCCSDCGFGTADV